MLCVALKIKRLEILLNKCKETIKNNKERSVQLGRDKDALQKQVRITASASLLVRNGESARFHWFGVAWACVFLSDKAN